ncbi:MULTISPECIES: MFS transporter [unclassified Paenibacillus]|uniref:MFS transporter n=1 Tax=unclassified Paenibacillus TaxID=185978 RepID=UPI001AEA1884|nr:MFS family permease [Paenibacillus sp. PvP091]MBP1170545.1 MFS family permease [Paenibacillus sp. PvR098]MBP2441573.1 MFS family permease [Paenibacillus sp. PvP052]
MEHTEKKRLLLITAVALGIMLNPLNTTMISVALSRLQEDFHISFMDISWLISTYYLASAIAQPVMGRFSDLYGRKRFFLVGLLMVTVSSMLAPLSPSFHWLLAFRVIQAVGTSALFPSGMGIIRSSITENQARALGILTIFSSTSAALGPSIGGLLIHYGDWPAIFLFNLPVILLSFVLAVKIIPADVKQNVKHIKIDIWGIILFSLLIFIWLLFLISVSQEIKWWGLCAGIALAVIFYVYESRQEKPFIDVHFMKQNVNVTLIYAQFILVNIITYSIVFGIPLYLQNDKVYDTQKTGLIMLSMSVFGILITPLTARWLERSGTRYPLIVGTGIVMVGILLLLTIQEKSGPLWIFIVLSILGVSIGMMNISLQTALYSFVFIHETGVASGLFMTSRYLGSIISSILLGIVFGVEITIRQLHWMGFICVVISVFMLFFALRLPQTNQGFKEGV